MQFYPEKKQNGIIIVFVPCTQ